MIRNSEQWFEDQQELEQRLSNFRKSIKELNNHALLVSYHTKLKLNIKSEVEKESIYILKDEILKRMG